MEVVDLMDDSDSYADDLEMESHDVEDDIFDDDEMTRQMILF